ncbi:cell division protein SepF [Frigoribacterium sp. CG_9.8]|jgi:cell division inhibitor SepF|uniref:cell division protein SepF n=1 Tax=Frigoribacterium sp. CG_9.8 TaxID=2787733 RepID=UPI0018CAFA52|nr:cell division protein SepF [Frigoribacterium sp. CG_9.8]MBG6107876.1 cell division inhibitor SepF [Frigoribacterium sp. CG_9.8]
MANPLRKTMVYLGLADEEFDYQEAPQAAPVPVAKDARESGHAPQASGTRAPVTPLRRAPSQKNVSNSEMNEILTVHPRHYKDAQAIAEAFRDGIPVIINLSQMSEPDARRLVDFASGLSQGLYGKIERVTSKVFLLSPAHVAVSGDQGTDDSDVDASFFAQS